MECWKKQFKGLVQTVQTKKGDTKELILSLLETRLDNVVYRLGFAKTRYMGRQMVSHGHILVNNKKVTIPSYQVKVDDKISIGAKMQGNPVVMQNMEEKPEVLGFLAKEGMSGKVVRMPKTEDVVVPFDLQLIIEYYSR